MLVLEPEVKILPSKVLAVLVSRLVTIVPSPSGISVSAAPEAAILSGASALLAATLSGENTSKMK